jgi:hypothetical protein
MPLPLPNLDDRRWADLVDEGHALIPRYAPEWTDHNISDPGVTLIELFAWMTESSVYALNRITRRHRNKFLSLIGFAPNAPVPSRIVMSLAPPAIAPFVLPAGVEFSVSAASGPLVQFRTLRAVTVSDVELAAVQIDRGAGLENRTIEWTNGLPLRVFGGDPQPGAAVYFGFKTVRSKTPVSVALRFVRPGNTALTRALNSADERARLIAERIAATRACRKPLPEIDCPGVSPAPIAALLPPYHSARIVWEAYTGTWTALTSIDPPASPAEGQVADDTRSLTLDGMVELNLPASIVQKAHGADPRPLFYVRCRLDSGWYDATPELLDISANAVAAEQSTWLWHRFTIPAAVTPTGTSATVPTPGATTRLRMKLEPSGAVNSLAFDPAAAGLPDVLVLSYEKPAGVDGHLTLATAYAGRAQGLPDEEFAIGRSAIVQDDDLAVFSHDGAQWQRWEIRPSFDASGRRDVHCTLDAARSVLRFGDGERGRVLRRGDSIFVAAHATLGGAPVVREGARVQILDSPVNHVLLNGFPVPINQLADMTRPVWPAAGGADQETLAHASGRAAEALHAHERLVDLAERMQTTTLDDIDTQQVRALPPPSNAVSLLDLERMALDVPGTRVARARAWPSVHPQFGCLSAPGWITLVVIPQMPVDQPQPSRGLLRTLERYLNRRRMVATVLRVVGPVYTAVSVSAVVSLRRGADATAAKARIEGTLRTFLNPLKGGPAGRGWPFGRAVYRAEILQLIDGVAGVDHVLDLTLSAAGGPALCGNVTLCPTGLAAAGTLDIRIG